MILYDNQERAYSGIGMDEVYKSSTARYTHQTQSNYLDRIIRDGLVKSSDGKGVSALDIGCGQGALLDILYSKVKKHGNYPLDPGQFYGLDVSAVGIAQADANYPDYCWIVDSFQDFCGRAELLGLVRHFSIILNRGGLTAVSNMKEYSALLAEVNRLLADDGIYLFSQSKSYYRIWLNQKLSAESDGANPGPSIFTMASKVLECLRLYELPGDYIGVYRKRSEENASLQTADTVDEPYCVDFKMNTGQDVRLYVAGDQEVRPLLSRQLLCRDEFEDFTYSVPAIYNEPRNIEEQKLCILASNLGKVGPRVFISGCMVRVPPGTALQMSECLVRTLSEVSRPIYFPRTFQTVRDLTRFLPEIRESVPDIVVTGLGFEDHRCDPTSPHPLVDPQEFVNRLDAFFLSLRQENITPIWCASRLMQAIALPNGSNFYDVRITKQFADLERTICAKHQVPIVDVADILFLQDRDEVRKRITAEINAAVVATADYKGHVDEVPKSMEQTFYRVPTSATLTFSSSRTMEIDQATAEYLYFSAPEVIYNNQLNGGVYDISVINGVDMFSRVMQKSFSCDLLAAFDASLPNVLILGDSTKMRARDLTGYGQKAYEALRGRANIIHVPNNFGGSASQLMVLSQIKDKVHPQVVHVNAGLHDLMLNRWTSTYHQYRSPDDYRANVRKLIQTLKEIHSVESIIWATMTPIHPDWHDIKPDGDPREWTRNTADIVEYNLIACEVAKDEGVRINDLFSTITDAGIDTCILRDGVHLTDHGAAIAGNIVANVITEELSGVKGPGQIL